MSVCAAYSRSASSAAVGGDSLVSKRIDELCMQLREIQEQLKQPQYCSPQDNLRCFKELLQRLDMVKSDLETMKNPRAAGDLFSSNYTDFQWRGMLPATNEELVRIVDALDEATHLEESLQEQVVELSSPSHEVPFTTFQRAITELEAMIGVLTRTIKEYSPIRVIHLNSEFGPRLLTAAETDIESALDALEQCRLQVSHFTGRMLETSDSKNHTHRYVKVAQTVVSLAYELLGTVAYCVPKEEGSTTCDPEMLYRLQRCREIHVRVDQERKDRELLGSLSTLLLPADKSQAAAASGRGTSVDSSDYEIA